MRRTAIGILIAALIACADPLPPPKVDFLIDAPLCSSTIPVSLWVDGLQVGVDTFVVHYGPPHERTRAFETSVGTHKLAVKHYPNGVLIQEDSTVALKAGQIYTFTVGFYCS